MRIALIRHMMMVCAVAACAAGARQYDAEKLGEVFARELAEKTKELCAAYPDVRGNFKLNMTIERNGTVTLARATDIRLNDTEPITGMLEAVYKWKFSPLAIENRSVEITQTLVFGATFDSTRIFFMVMGAIMATIAVLIVLVRIG